MRRPYIDFMGKRYLMFAISGVVLVVAIGALLFRGVNLGIEFKGGTVITLVNVKTTSIADARTATVKAGLADPQHQSTPDGFITRSTETSTTLAESEATAIGTSL